MRYAWEMEAEYLQDFRIPRMLRKSVKKRLNALRRWDMTTAKRVDTFIANSTETQERIRKIYNRDSVVIHPPAREHFFNFPLTTDGNKDAPYLAIGRMVPYKRFDLLINCANAHKIPLVIAGTGPDEASLKRIAGPTVTFLGFVPDDDLTSVYAEARALLLPQHEDAGIVPLEAQACGTPVIAYARGGALDTVINSETGVFFAEQTIASLKDAIDRFETMSLDSGNIRKHAEQFSSERFRERINALIAINTGTLSPSVA